MNKSRISQIYAIIEKVELYSLAISISLLFLVVLYIVLKDFLHINISLEGHLSSITIDAFLYVLGIGFSVMIITFLILMWLSPFIDKEQKGQLKSKKTFDTEEEKIILKELSTEQVEIVHGILRDIPKNEGHLKTSELVQILRALKDQDYLDDTDLQRVIDWVENVTGESVDSRNFKYDYSNKFSEKGVTKWRNKLVKDFARIENT